MTAAPALAAAGTPMLLTHMGEVEDAFAALPVHRRPDGAVDMTEEEATAAAGKLPHNWIILVHRRPDGAVDMTEEEARPDGAVDMTEEEASLAAAKPPPRLNVPRQCYICKRPFLDLHFFYDQLCPACAALNYQKRNEKADLTGRVAIADLTGRVAIVTGARVKIGFRCALKLLRCGATVLATSRFAADCARSARGRCP
ncbi:hypothetical protein T484DRAFT_1802719 [Baffinella frigidus]|nr:hypothetical protein T484DRAFT_1802719 [Cryptophyta sp. CCMP2293]